MPTVRNGILFTIFSFFNSGISFLLLIIIAGFISPEGYGFLNVFNTSIVLASFFISLNCTGIISVNFFKNAEVELKKTINAVFIITVFCFVLSQFILFLFGREINDTIGLSVGLQFAALCICFFQVFHNVNLDIWRLQENPVNYGLYSLSNVLLNFFLTIIFIVVLKYDWLGRVYSQFVTTSLYFIISLVFLLKRKYLTVVIPNLRNFKDVLSFGIPLIPHGVSFWLRQGLDRYIINFSQGPTIVGLFSFSYNFANIIQIIGTAFNATNSVFIYKNLAKEDPEGYIRKKIKRQTKLMLLFYLGITIFICLISYLLIPFFFPEYYGSLNFLIPQCFGAMFQAIYLLFVNFLFYYKKTKRLMYITFSYSLLHGILSIILTPYSVTCTAYIGLLSNFLIALSVYFYSRKIYVLF